MIVGARSDSEVFSKKIATAFHCHCEERSDEAISKEIATPPFGRLAMTKGEMPCPPLAGSQ